MTSWVWTWGLPQWPGNSKSRRIGRGSGQLRGSCLHSRASRRIVHLKLPVSPPPPPAQLYGGGYCTFTTHYSPAPPPHSPLISYMTKSIPQLVPTFWQFSFWRWEHNRWSSGHSVQDRNVTAIGWGCKQRWKEVTDHGSMDDLIQRGGSLVNHLPSGRWEHFYF